MNPLAPTAVLPPGYLLRRMRPADTDATARLHRRLLPNGLFPQLGRRFVRRWHATFLDTQAATGMAVEHQGEVVAFVVATLDQRLYLRHALRTHRRPLAWRGALGMLARPHVLLHFLRTRVRAYSRHLLPGVARRDPGTATAPPRDRRLRVAVVHAVVTSEQARGLGCARALLEAVVAAARHARADHVALVTDVAHAEDRTGPAGAAAMYEALDWDRTEVRRHRDGRWVAEYRVPLGPAGRDADGATGPVPDPPTARPGADPVR